MQTQKNTIDNCLWNEKQMSPLQELICLIKKVKMVFSATWHWNFYDKGQGNMFGGWTSHLVVTTWLCSSLKYKCERVQTVCHGQYLDEKKN